MKTPPWLLAPPGSLREDAVVSLEQAEGRHAAGPLRLRTGDEVVLADGAGRLAEARLAIAGKNSVAARVTRLRVVPEPVEDGVTLVLAVIEPRAMDWAVQKSVEIGIRRFQPVISDRTQTGGRAAAARSGHWRRIALQALKQCRRPWAMEILEATSLAEFIGGLDGGGVVADPAGVTAGRLGVPRNRVLAVGPEGGFSAVEDELFAGNGWARLRLGVNVLRSETAAVVGGAVMVAAGDEKPAGEG